MADTSTDREKGRKLFYGWIIVIAGAVVIAVSYGIVYSFGVFLPHFQETFKASSASILGAYSLCIFLYMASSTLWGWIVDRYGPKVTSILGGALLMLGFLLASRAVEIWHLYVTYALIGIGMSPAYNPIMTTISRWFTRERGMALGIISTGTGLGPLIMAPLVSYMISATDWRLTAVFLGLLAGGVISGAAFIMKRTPAEMNLLPDGDMPQDNSSSIVRASTTNFTSGGLSLKQASKTRAFWFLAGMYLMIGFGLQLMLVHIVPYSQWRGLSPITAATVLSTVSGVSIVGRMVMGTVSDRIGRRKGLGICLFMEGAMILSLTFATGPWLLFGFAAILGFFYGGHVPQLPALVSDTLGLAHMGLVLGATSTFWGIGGAISPVLAGRIMDTTGNYPVVFIIGGAATISAAIISMFIKKP